MIDRLVRRPALAMRLVVLLGAGSWIPAARAEGPLPIDLEWIAPAECPSRERVVASITEMARAPTAGKRVRARANVVERGSIDAARVARTTFVVDLVVDDGTRHLEADDCAALSSAIAFIVALAIDPNAKAPPPAATTPGPGPGGPATPGAPSTSPSAPASAPSSAAPPAAAPPAAPPSSAAGAPTPAPAPKEPSVSPVETAEAPTTPFTDRWLGLSALARVEGATLPNLALGPAAAVGLRRALFSAEVLGALLPSQTASLRSAGTDAGATVNAAAVAARVAARFRVGSGEVGPLLGATWHHLDAAAFGTRVVASGNTTVDYASLAFGARGTVGLTPALGLRGDGGAALTLAKPELVIDNAGLVHRPAPLAFFAEVGLELRVSP